MNADKLFDIIGRLLTYLVVGTGALGVFIILSACILALMIGAWNNPLVVVFMVIATIVGYFIVRSQED